MAKFERLAAFVFGAALLLQATAILVRPTTFQWDLVAYARGVSLLAAGQNPYDTTLAVAPMAGSEVAGAGHLPFVYPPHTLPLFRLLFAGGFRAAYVVFLGFKVALVLGAARAWTLAWIRRDDRALFLLFAIAAFNGCASIDLAAGNVASYEAFFVAVGFVFFARGRHGAFAACIVAASVFKLTPLVLLAVLAFDRRGGGLRALVVTLGAVAFFAGVAFAVAPQLHRAFFEAATGLTAASAERAFQNPSSRELARDIARVAFGARAEGSAAESAGVVVYGAWVLAVGVATARALAARARDARLSGDEQRAYALTIACLAYALTMPRFKDYSFLLVVAPFVAALGPLAHSARVAARRLRFALIALALFPSDALASSLSERAVAACPRTAPWLALGYLPLLTTSFAWAAALIAAPRAAARGPEPTNVDIAGDVPGPPR